MNQMTPTSGGWNLFAQVLSEILATRGMGLGHLDDRAQVHSEKVRRLQRSLSTPKNLPVLNIDEMDRVIVAFHLTPQEVVRLRAAILATSIEATLLDRIAPLDALKAAQEILPIIEQALVEHEREPVGIGAVKGGAFSMGDDSEIDRKLAGALAAIDRATLLLHLSGSAASQTERIECAEQARQGFATALAQLDQAEAALKAGAAWRLWHEEAREGLAAARQRLGLLGA